MKKILISGSLAYDCIYRFPEKFSDKFIKTDLDSLSISFYVTDKTVDFGGCAGNIAYNGRLLGKKFLILGICGKDFLEYDNWLEKNNIDRSLIIKDAGSFTSQASVLNDKDGRQITFFYGGAAANSKKHAKKIDGLLKLHTSEILFALISPNDINFIKNTLDACIKYQIPYFLDPGQALPYFSKTDLLNAVSKSKGLFLNEYEFALIQKRSGLTARQLFEICPFVVVTLGDKGSEIYFDNERIFIPTKKTKKSADPTGCGDAYRASFLSVIAEEFPNINKKLLTDAGKKGTELALACLQTRGTQNHKI